MKLNDLFTRAVVTAKPDEPVSAIARRMQEHNVGTVIIVEDQRPVGIITDRDLALALGTERARPASPASAVMSRHVVAIPSDADVYTAARFIRESEVRRLPIVDHDDRVVGLVSLDDVLQVIARELYDLAEGIRRETRVT